MTSIDERRADSAAPAMAVARTTPFCLLREEFWLLVVPLAVLLAASSVLHLVLDIRQSRTPLEWGIAPNLWLSSAWLVMKLGAIAFFVHRSWGRRRSFAQRGAE